MRRVTINRISSNVFFLLLFFENPNKFFTFIVPISKLSAIYNTKKCATKFKLRIFVTKTISYTFPIYVWCIL